MSYFKSIAPNLWEMLKEPDTICKKVSFTKKEAKTVLNKIDGSKHWRKEKRYYYCTGCNAWHLTSTEEYTETLKIELKLKNKWKSLIS